MSYTAKGVLHVKYEPEQKSEKFTSRDFILKIEGNKPEYPEYIKFQMIQDRCELIDNIDEGTEIEVSFDLKGKAWNDKWFTNLQAWKVLPIGNVHKKRDELPSQAEQKEAAAESNPGYENLPF